MDTRLYLVFRSENHEGAITVRSEQGKGTTFFIYLPYVKVEFAQLTNSSSTNT
jgi:signal transduction histidine kinase